MNKTSNKRMESSLHSYLQNFQIAQVNLNKLIEEERRLRKINKHKVRH